MKRGSKHSAEARAKMSLKSAAKWRDPEYRARQVPRLRALDRKGVGRPMGSKNPPEAIEKSRQATIRRWQDPEYRARMVAQLRAVSPKGLEAARKARHSVRPPRRGTPEYGWYRKVVKILGPQVARSMTW